MSFILVFSSLDKCRDSEPKYQDVHLINYSRKSSPCSIEHAEKNKCVHDRRRWSLPSLAIAVNVISLHKTVAVLGCVTFGTLCIYCRQRQSSYYNTHTHTHTHTSVHTQRINLIKWIFAWKAWTFFDAELGDLTSCSHDWYVSDDSQVWQ
jgi:membrane glycosyltransferase